MLNSMPIQYVHMPTVLFAMPSDLVKCEYKKKKREQILKNCAPLLTLEFVVGLSHTIYLVIVHVIIISSPTVLVSESYPVYLG